MKVIKKVFPLLLVLFMLVSALAGCSPSENDGPGLSGKETEEIEHKLLSDWFDYLFFIDRDSADTLWAISYMEHFLDNTTWDALQCARMAVSSASAYIENREKPEESMTMEDYNTLTRQGKDVSFVQIDFLSVEGTRQQLLDVLLNISIDLESGVFWQPDCKTMREDLQVHRKILETEMAQLATVTDFLLLSLESQELVGRFRSFTEENCPTLSAYLDSTEQSQDALEKKATLLADKLEELNYALSEIVGKKRANLKDYADLINAGDWEALRQDSTKIEGLPLLLPLPDWDGDTQTTCYWLDADGAVSIPGEAEVIDRPPDRCVFLCDGMTEEMFTQYIDLLSSLGYEASMADTDTDSRTVFYELGESQMMLSWTPYTAEIAMLKNPICFVPFWYLTQF